MSRVIRVGLWGFYEQYFVNGRLFTDPFVPNGRPNAGQPACDLYAYGQAHGIDFVTLDQVDNIADIDAVIFSDRPKSDSALSNTAMRSDIFKILTILECPLIKPDNWDLEFHKQFDLIFTWADDLVDGRRYIKNNFITDLGSVYDFSAGKAAFSQRKLATMINSSVLLDDAYASQFPTQLYTHRVQTIRWFEANAPQDFDLYGLGWDARLFPSYKGEVQDKLAALSRYRFAICYENAQGYPGYITEKIQDCLLAGVVPVYGGAPNIDRWIPSDCYIDIRKFQSYGDLYAYLVNMDAHTYGFYLDRIQDFFTSGKVYPFSTECFITTLTKFLTWGAQARRGELPIFAAAADGVSLQTHCLEQDVHTMQVNIVPKVADISVAPSHSVASIRSEMANLKRDNFIICLGYGPELPVFLRARDIWKFYASHFPQIEIIFVRESDKLTQGEVVFEGDELVIGIGQGFKSHHPGYANTGIWSATENERVLSRGMVTYDYLLRRYPHPFHLYQCTITSLVDFRGLFALLDTVVPQERCFAGMLGTLRHAPCEGVGITHGANTLLSRDVIELLRARYIPGHPFNREPSDHWTGLLLQDVPRTALPLFSFNKPRIVGDNLDDVASLTENLLREGHYHFRVKTTSAQSETGRREDVDPWIMLRVAEAILRTSPMPNRNRTLQEKFARCCEDPRLIRDFPIDDAESALFYKGQPST